jgi:putative hydrolase of HD superfamily
VDDLDIYKNKVLEIADMCLDFGKVERRTFHQDGERAETDTDHTVMLAIVSVVLAEKLYKNKLDIGLVSQFAMIHDLLEVYAGDTDTLTNTSKEHFADKNRREAEAFLKIKEKFGSVFPYLDFLIERYERQEELEAKFVKVCDKIM